MISCLTSIKYKYLGNNAKRERGCVLSRMGKTGRYGKLIVTIRCVEIVGFRYSGLPVRPVIIYFTLIHSTKHISCIASNSAVGCHLAFTKLISGVFIWLLMHVDCQHLLSRQLPKVVSTTGAGPRIFSCIKSDINRLHSTTGLIQLQLRTNLRTRNKTYFEVYEQLLRKFSLNSRLPNSGLNSVTFKAMISYSTRLKFLVFSF